jgi:hypothetical protein
MWVPTSRRNIGGVSIGLVNIERVVCVCARLVGGWLGVIQLLSRLLQCNSSIFSYLHRSICRLALCSKQPQPASHYSAKLCVSSYAPDLQSKTRSVHLRRKPITRINCTASYPGESNNIKLHCLVQVKSMLHNL